MSAPGYAQPGWTPPVPVGGVGLPRVAIDAAGNALAAWRDNSGVRAADYSATADVWSTPALLLPTADRGSEPFAAMNAAGRGLAVWTNFGPPQTTAVKAEYAVFSVQTRQWSARQTLADGFSVLGLGIDAAGNAIVALSRNLQGGVEFAAARYDVANGTWGTPATLRQTGASTQMRLVVSAGGDAFAVLEDVSFNGSIAVVRFDGAARVWQSPVSLGSCVTGDCDFGLVVAVAADGRALAGWAHDAGGALSIRTRLFENGAWTLLPDLPGGLETRVALGAGHGALTFFDRASATLRGATFDLSSRTWSTPADIGTTGPTRPASGPPSLPRVELALNEAGTGFVVWDVFTSGLPNAISAAAVSAATGQWSAPTALTTAGSIPSLAVSPAGGAIAAWWDQTATPAVTKASRYTVGSPLPVLAPAVVNRPNVTFVWTPPASGPAPSAYALSASLSAGGPPVAQLPVGTQTSFTVAAPDGTFFVRIIATVNGATVASNEIRVDVVPPVVPSAPQSFAATVNGNVITLAWAQPASSGGAVVTGYVLEAGSAAGTSNLGTLPFGDVTSFVSPAVPNGSYYLRVRARNAAGIGAATADTRVVVGPAPSGPPSLTGTGAPGGQVSLTWTAPTSGAAPTGYQLHAGSAPGASDVAVLNLPATTTSLAASGVPAGTYYIRVAAASAQGLGDVSNEVTLVVP